MIEAIVLHVEASWTSPWVFVAHVALREKGVPFTTSISMVRPGTGAIDLLHERTLTGTAPVLQHGTLWIAESLAIVEYLEETFPRPRVYPDAVGARARVRQLMAWLRADTDHLALRAERPTERVFYPHQFPPPAPLSPAARRAAEQSLAVATRLGAGGDRFAFETFGVIDVDLAVLVARVQAGGDLAVPGALAAYRDRVFAHPSVRELVLHTRPPNSPLG